MESGECKKYSQRKADKGDNALYGFAFEGFTLSLASFLISAHTFTAIIPLPVI
jgi:hypothetical protein